MPKFRLSFRRDYGDISLEGDTEKEILENFNRLKKLQSVIDEKFGASVQIPEDVSEQIRSFANSKKTLIVLFFSNRPLKRSELIKESKRLGVPSGWWNGSNFQRDLKGFPRDILEKVPIRKGVSALRLTKPRRRFVKSLLRSSLAKNEVSEEE